MLKYQNGIPAEIPMNPEILSQIMSAQGAGQGADFNGNPTPNISGKPSFADMYQEIKARYDKLIEPLEKKMKQLQMKLQENPTDATIKNELSRIEYKIDKLEKQEDMEIQQLEAEVEQSGQQIEQQKQMQGIDMPQQAMEAPEYIPEGGQQPEMLPEMMQQLIENEESEQPQIMQKGGWWKKMLADLKDRPLSDYVQIGTRAGELISDYGKRMANTIIGMKKTDNPYPQYIDRLNRSNDDFMKANKRYYDNMETQAMRDTNRVFNTSQFASLQGKFTANEAIRQKSNDLLEKIRTERQREEASTRAQHENLLYNAFKDYSSQRENNEMFNMNNVVKAYETMNKDRNDKLQRMYEMADLFSDASQDQKDFNFIMGPWSNDYKMFSTMRNFLSRLTPEERQKLFEDLEYKEDK